MQAVERLALTYHHPVAPILCRYLLQFEVRRAGWPGVPTPCSALQHMPGEHIRHPGSLELCLADMAPQGSLAVNLHHIIFSMR